MKVLIYGDSMLFGVCNIKGCTIHNECVPGLTLTESLRLEEKNLGLSFVLDEDKYDSLVLCLGTNDFCERLGSEIIRDLLKLVQISVRRIKMEKVIVLGFPFQPTTSRNLKYLIQEKFPMVVFLPFIDLESETDYLEDDGIHLNKKGQESMVSLLSHCLHPDPPRL